MNSQDEIPERGRVTPPLARTPLVILAILLFAISALSIIYLVRERGQVRALTANRDQLNTALEQHRAQVAELSDKVNQLAAAQAAAAQRAAEVEAAQSARQATVVRVPSKRRAAADPRWKKLQDQLVDHQKKIESTQQDLQSAREELQGKLDSTREDLNSSIARTHDDLVELQKRGERNYYEFTLSKSKQFQKAGPLGLSLRKADVKHKRYDLKLIVDDFQLEKKRVNLYEPVLVYLADRPQPVELVVNQIGKNEIKGYISEPKYKKSELATVSAPSKQQELTTRQ